MDLEDPVGTARDAAPGATLRRWQVWVDTGGTFTDCLAVDPSGRLLRAKVLSSSALRATVAAVRSPRRLRLAAHWRVPDGFFAGCTFRLLGGDGEAAAVAGWDAADSLLELARPVGRVSEGMACELRSPEEAPVLAARLVTGTAPPAALPEMAMRLATTRGTNALLERRGAPTALFITRGFADLLRIGTQQRPELFDLRVVRPEPLASAVVEVDERLAADGSVVRTLDPGALRSRAQELLASGITTAAVALMHSYRNPVHEERLAALLLEVGFAHVSTSAALAPLITLLSRAETAVVDATLAPVISDYLGRVRGGLAGGTLHVMTSAGGLVGAEAYRPKDSLLSGPAGGVVGAALAGRRSGRPRVITFDMGGTSTDVARVDSDYEYVFEHVVGDAHLVAPALAVETVAAGGGSVCRFDGQRLLVGPESAGASPGPACYGAGGPLTLTDVNLLLGRLDPERFEIPLDPGAAERALEGVLVSMAAGGARPGPEQALAGFLEIANERMADAIRRISLRRGYDPADYAMVAFGGAGGQHACAVAALLGIATVIVPPDAGLLSALGLGHAVIERFVQRQVLAPLDEVGDRVQAWLETMAAEAAAAVVAEGVAAEAVTVRRRILNLRFAGQDSTLAVDHDPAVAPEAAFAGAYAALFGYRPEGRAVELESLRVVASTRPPAPRPVAPTVGGVPVAPTGRRRAFLGGSWQEVPAAERPALPPGARLAGPALVFERHSATVVEPGWSVDVDAAAALVLRRSE